ncbi:MAG: DNA translocase FtsK 4TM domain-containing protein, partial [Chromatiaceae bacterium]
MAQATRVGQLTFSDYVERAVREGAMWALVCVALYLVLSLVSYSPRDPGWSHIGPTEHVANAGGRVGAWFADVAFFLFGVFAYLIPVMVAWSAYLVFRRPDRDAETQVHLLALRWLGFFITLAAGSSLASLHLPDLIRDLPNGVGGGLGHYRSGSSLQYATVCMRSDSSMISRRSVHCTHHHGSQPLVSA